jgi:ABC-type nitrate/sulfonate/bicarbonate transport system substrate-binding protein
VTRIPQRESSSRLLHTPDHSGQRRIRAVCFAVLFASCAIFPWPCYSASTMAASTTINYHLDGAIGSSEAGAIIALNRGYFGEAGLDVRIVNGTDQGQSTVSVANSPKAIGVASVFDFLKARASVQRIVAFASAYTRNPITFYARRDSNVRSVADFAGKTVAYETGHPSAIVFDALMARNHVSQSTIKVVSGLRTVMALVSSQIDILPGEITRRDPGLGYRVSEKYRRSAHACRGSPNSRHRCDTSDVGPAAPAAPPLRDQIF